ncbi:putative endonuclease or glycosyl hydrolase [Raphanus sativus]|nr:putative endonuclease or glycosyl hydrolase [Raphanus sativus]
MERQQQGKGKEKAWVIWNISMCPIPDGVDPRVMGTTIQKALESAGHVRRYDQISITAFGNNLIQKQDVTRKLYSTGKISLMHGTEYQTQLLIWSQRNRPPATMMIIDSHERLGVGWLASTLSNLKDEGYTILLAYPQCDGIAKPLPRSYSKQWYWQDLVSDEQKTITSLDLKEDCYERNIVFCSLCYFESQIFEDLPTHLKTEGHAYSEWNHSCDDSVDWLNLANLHLGRSEEWDFRAAEDFFTRLLFKYGDHPDPVDLINQNKELDILAARKLLTHLREKYGVNPGYLVTCWQV